MLNNTKNYLQDGSIMKTSGRASVQIKQNAVRELSEKWDSVIWQWRGAKEFAIRDDLVRAVKRKYFILA
jgi:hypothetical protein